MQFRRVVACIPYAFDDFYSHSKLKPQIDRVCFIVVDECDIMMMMTTVIIILLLIIIIKILLLINNKEKKMMFLLTPMVC